MRYAIKHAEWLTLRRVKLISSIALLFSCLTIIFMFATATNLFDLNGNLIGSDYSAFWSAGRFALDGQAAEAYDLDAQQEQLKTLFNNPDTKLTAWLHPPVFYLITTPFATLPYLPSLLCWVGLGLVAYALMIHRIEASRTAMVLALAFPPALLNVVHGQTGLLYAALFAGALMMLNHRPWIAGLLIGVLVIKPQLGLPIPFALLAGGFFRSFVAAALTVIALCGMSAAFFGPSVWAGFFEATEISRGMILESGGVGWHKFQSAFASFRLWGAPVSLAYLLHFMIALPIAAYTIWAWTRDIDPRLKQAALITSCCLMTPYIYDYDLALLAPGLGWFILYTIEHGALAYEKFCLGCAWMAPSVARPIAEFTHIPLGLFSMWLIFALIARRIWREAKAIQDTPLILTAP